MVKILPITARYLQISATQNQVKENCITQPSASVMSGREVAFCGAYMPAFNSVDLSPALNLDVIHCPVCGAQTLSEKSLDAILNKAEKVNNTGEFLNLLKEYENHIPMNMRHILFVGAEKFKDNLDAPLSSYVISCRDKAKIDRSKCLEHAKMFLTNYSNSLSDGDERIVIDEVNNAFNPDEGLGSYFGNIGSVFVSPHVHQSVKDYLSKNITPKLNDGTVKCCDIDGVESLPKNVLAKTFAENIFSQSVIRLTTIQNSKTFPNMQNNSVLVCDSCCNKAPSRAFMDFNNVKNYAVAKVLMFAYLGDVAKAMGEGYIDTRKYYFSNFPFYVNKLSRGNISFSDVEINRLHNLRSMAARRDVFAPIEQSKVDVPCAECGSIMLPHVTRLNIHRDLLLADNMQDYFEVLKRYDKFIGSHARDSRDVFFNVMSENPDISMDEFLFNFNRRMERIAKEDTLLALEEFDSSIDYVRAEGTPEQLEAILYVKDKFNAYLENGWFKDFNYTNMLKNVVDIDLDSPNCTKGIYSLLSDLKTIAYKMSLIQPVSQYDNDDKDPVFTILFNLFKSDVATADYLVATKKGGKGSKDNLIGLCKGCNTLKNNKGVSAWYAQHINVRKNFHKHLEVVNEMAKEGIIEGYDDWAASIAQSMYELTRERYDIRWRYKKDKI